MKTIKKQHRKGTSLKKKSAHKSDIISEKPAEKMQKALAGYGDPLNVKLSLNTLKNSRNSMTRLIRLYSDGVITHTQFRNLIYAFSHLINFWKYDVEDEIKKLWETVNNGNQKRN